MQVEELDFSFICFGLLLWNFLGCSGRCSTLLAFSPKTWSQRGFQVTGSTPEKPQVILGKYNVCCLPWVSCNLSVVSASWTQRGAVHRSSEHSHNVHSKEGESPCGWMSALSDLNRDFSQLSSFPNKQGMFEPFMKSFYVRSTDATHIKTLKVTTTTLCISRHNMEIWAHEMKSSSNFSCLRCSWKSWPTWLLKQTSPLFWGNFRFVFTALCHLQLSNTSPTNSFFVCVCIYCFGFQTYVKSQDKAFAAATIQAIGRCATNISEVTDTCLNGLVLLLSNRDGKSPFWPVDICSVSCICPIWLCLDCKRLRRDCGGWECGGD